MAGVLAAMNTINAEMDTSRITVESNTEAIGKQTATLVNGLGLMVDASSDRLAHAAATAAVDARFNLNMAEARNKVRLAAATKGVNDTLTVFGKNADGLTNSEAVTRANIDSIKTTTRGSSLALSSRINDVLDQVMASASKIQSDASIGSSDVMTRLALVRMAVTKFLTLWNEYAANMDRKLHRFHSADAEFVAQMENDVKAKLGGSENNVNQTDAKISALKDKITLAVQDQIDYENFFNTKLQELKDSLKRQNDARTVRTLHANDLVNQFEDYQVQSVASMKEDVKKLIDEFDDRISGHVGTMDQFQQGTLSASLIEQQIKDLDAQVHNVLAAH
jgi:hypothetical protein